MKKIFSALSIFLLVVMLAACSRDKYDIDYSCSQDYGGATLNFLNWGEYIDPKLIAEFEDICNVKVKQDIALSNELFKAEIEKGIDHSTLTQYDLAVPSDYMVEYLRKNNKLMEIDYNNIPNFQNLDKNYLNKTYDPNNKYSVPYFWGTIGIMYNRDKLDALGINEADINSWDDIFNLTTKDKLYNQVYMYDTLRDIYMTALLSLGYDLNSTNVEELKAATSLLKAQYKTVAGYGTDDIKTLIAQGNITAGVVMNGDYLSIIFSEDVNVGFVVPEEGTNLWFDSFIIPKSAQDKRLAEEFINFMLAADVSYYNAKYVGYSDRKSVV